MDQERFQRMIEAYGAEPGRWPEPEREAAQSYLAEHPRAMAELESQRALDETLDAWTSKSVTKAFRDRVLASAPHARRPAWTWPKLWLSGAGLAAACGAGAIVGATLIGPSLANAVPSETAGPLSDGVSVMGAPLDTEPMG